MKCSTFKYPVTYVLDLLLNSVYIVFILTDTCFNKIFRVSNQDDNNDYTANCSRLNNHFHYTMILFYILVVSLLLEMPSSTHIYMK